MTAPGQTAGLSVFTDPLIRELGVSRTSISFSYLIGTLLGALAQPLIGRASDRFDARNVIATISAAFALILVGLSFVSGIVGLTFGYVGVRMAGQGALGLAVTTALSRTIAHRRGMALGVSAAIGSAGISLAPLMLEPVVAALGIHPTWRWEALAVAVIAIPTAYLLPRPTQPVLTKPGHAPITDDWTLPEAVRTGMFWVLAAAVSSSSMLGTALGFHQIAVLGERGLTPFQAAANFLPQTITALIATLVVGGLVDRVNPRIFIVGSMGLMAGALLMLPLVDPGWSAISYGLVLGASGGALRGMEAATFARFYGVGHIGSIRGVSTSISLAASALGPFALAVGDQWFRDFTTPAVILAAVPLAVLAGGLATRPPHRHTSQPDSPGTR